MGAFGAIKKWWSDYSHNNKAKSCLDKQLEKNSYNYFGEKYAGWDRGVSVDNNWITVRYETEVSDEKFNFYIIQVSRSNPNQAKVVIGYCDGGDNEKDKVTGEGQSFEAFLETSRYYCDHIEKIVQDREIEAPYRRQVDDIRSIMMRNKIFEMERDFH
jgi:hypothetical protein